MINPKKDSTKDNLVKAGIQVFAQKGFKQATVREICCKAGAGNINSINYYFKSKQGLYCHILELIFAEYETHAPEKTDNLTPEEKLKAFIQTYCTMLYKEDAFGSDLATIFVAEMTTPSPFLTSLIDTYNRPRVERHLAMIRELLGPDTPESVVRDCLVSISGQLLYYSFAWPVFSRLFPDYSPEENHATFADHVFSFSLGGIKQIQQNLRIQKEGDHG